MAGRKDMTFMETHFGTDMLLSAWLLLISTALFSVVYIYLFVMVTSSGVVTADDRIDYCYYISYIVSTLLFLVGSIFILHASYPEEMEKMLKLLMTMDVNNMTFTERYFTGTSILLTTWFFLFATLLLIVYPIWGLYTGDLDLTYGICYIIAILFLTLLILLWVVACFPENMVLNEMRGSSYFFDFLCCDNCCLCDSICGEGFCRTHLGSDFLVGAWGFFVFACVFLVAIIAEVAMDAMSYPAGSYIVIADVVLLFSSVLFLIGSGILLYTSYPQNMNSNYSWRY